jgi:hypothetical protein
MHFYFYFDAFLFYFLMLLPVSPVTVLLLLSKALFNSRAIRIRPDEPPSSPRLTVRMHNCNTPSAYPFALWLTT